MEQKQVKAHRPRAGMTYSLVDALTAAVVFLVGVVMMADNYRIGAGWSQDGPESGYFPFHIGLILCIAAIVVFLKSLFGKKRNNTIFVSRERFRLVLIVLIPTALYVLAVQILGMYVASALFIGGFMRLLGKTEWSRTVIVSVAVSVILFWMFEIQFMVPLPKGPLEALFGY
jgi:putative tricarboxylic transport membrane protein